MNRLFKKKQKPVGADDENTLIPQWLVCNVEQRIPQDESVWLNK